MKNRTRDLVSIGAFVIAMPILPAAADGDGVDRDLSDRSSVANGLSRGGGLDVGGPGDGAMARRTDGLITLASESRLEANASESSEKGATRLADSGDSKRRQRAALEEVVVTAQRREQLSIDVPMSISAITGEQLETAGIENIRDLSYAVPSLSVLETGPGRQMITIRGIAGQRGTSSLTGIYLDEMPLSGVQDGSLPSNADIQAIDIGRVEVLKGPQGTLFGEGAAGGVIRFITRDPELNRLGGDISTEFYDTTDGDWSEEVTGILNLPLATDVFGIRLAGKYESTSGWIDQPTIARENINDSEVKHVRLKALYLPTPKLRVTSLVEVHRNEGGAANIVNEEPLSESNFRQAVDPYLPTGYTDDYDLANLTATYDVGFAELLTSTSYAELDSRQSFTQLTPERPSPYLEIVADSVRDSKIVSQELRLTSSGQGPIGWTVGANYKDAELNPGRGPGGSRLILFGGSSGQLNLTVPGNTLSSLTSESWAVFGDASYKFPNHIEIGGGLRYFEDERGSLSIVPPTTPISSKFDKTTYRAYARYTPTKDASIYLTVGTGFRSGGFNAAFAVARGAPETILPETSLFYELGTKLLLANRTLRLEAAIFYGEYQDMMANRSVISPVDGALLSFTANGQSADLKGIEWMIGWAATDALSFTLTGDVTDTEITKVDPSDPAPIYFLGDPVSLVPEYTVSAAVDYAFRWNDSMPGFFNVTYDRKGKAFNTYRTAVTILDHQVVSDDLNFLSASIGAEWNSWRWRVFARNLLDEDGYLYPSESGWSAQARRRTIGVGLSKSF